MTSPFPDPRPRLGIALSGGGFRAAFFHIGLLARLAEMRLLHEVEVISTVSGGSVIGALYYLHLRRLLQEKSDAAIGPEDYLALVDGMSREFMEAVERNLRVRTFADPLRCLGMARVDYSRSDRMAQLYRRHLYGPIVEPELAARHVPLRGIKIRPCGAPDDFHPHRDNAQRRHKVPVLVINAAALNTGHKFQFTTSWLGEPRSQNDVDGNLLLRQVRFEGDCLPSKYLDLPLGVAVAASTAVPGIFRPLALTGLYPRLTPQLVDGGVHDNQGMEALADEQCTGWIVSDASGQIEDQLRPSTAAPFVVWRSNSILMDRVREEQYEAAALRRATGAIASFSYLHLRQGLPRREVTWIGGAEAPVGQQAAPPAVAVEVQRRLAAVRTDLDSFTEVEACALIADGYLIASQSLGEFAAHAGRTVEDERWVFRPLLAHLRHPGPQEAEGRALARQLAASRRKAAKLLFLRPLQGLACLAAQVAAGVGTAWLLLRGLSAVGPFWSAAILALLVIAGCLHCAPQRSLRDGVVSLVGRSPVEWALLPARIALASTTALLAIPACIHLVTSDRLFLHQGRLGRLVSRSSRPRRELTSQHAGAVPVEGADGPAKSRISR